VSAPPRRRTRLLAIAPDPARHCDQAGGVLSAARLVFGGALDDAYEVRMVDTLMRAHPRPGRLERVAGAVRRFVRTVGILVGWRPQVVVALCSEGGSYYEKSLLLGLGRLLGAKTFLCPRSGFQERWLAGSRMARLWMRRTACFTDAVVVQSRFWRDLHARYGIPESKLQVWTNAIDLRPWASIAAARVPASGRPFRFLFLGWAVKEKGLLELHRAAALLRERGGPEFEVTVAGDGALGRELLGPPSPDRGGSAVRFLGWVDEKGRAAELARADAFVLPTWAEGFPNALLEAMACSLPAIATPVGAIPEVIEDGVTGRLVPVHDPLRLAEAMDALRRDPEAAAAMGRRAHASLQGRFDAPTGLGRFRAILAGAC
jgi:glycosyltransferase involved in cell wall biosynthesis